MKSYMLGIFTILFMVTLGKQEINSVDSGVTFEVGNMKINTVEGSFKGMKGDVNFNPKDLKNSSFEVTIDAATVDTDNNKRDEHLKNKDFFEVEKYPTIKFKSDAIVRSKKEGYHIAKGKLTIHGVSKDVKIPFTHKSGIFEGTLKVNRFDYNVGKATSTFMVSDEVTVKIICKTK
ncbi:MAG: YceI family protein [Saprospiraceae bacterium]